MFSSSGKIWFRNVLEDQGYWNRERSHYKVPERGYYLISLRGLSRNGFPATYVRTLYCPQRQTTALEDLLPKLCAQVREGAM